MDNQQYNPSGSSNAPDDAQNGTAPQQNSAQTPPGGQNRPPYGQNQNGYSPYGQNPYTQNPYGQGGQPPYSGAYRQNPYGGTGAPYHAQNYGAPRQYQNPQPPYGQNPYAQPPYGQYSPVGGYVPQQDPNFLRKKQECGCLRKMSMAHGLSVLGFTVLAFAISLILACIPGFKEAYEGNQNFKTALDAAYALIIIFVPFFLSYLYQKKRKLIKDLPLGTPYDNKAAVLLVFAGLMCCIAGSYATGIFSSIVENMFGITFTMPENDTVINSVPTFLLTVLGTAVIPAFIEEFAIRGTVLQALRRYGDRFAILMSALVFAFMHGNMVQIPFAFIAGIAIGYAVTVSGTMWVGVAIHFLNNLAAVVMQTAADALPEATANIVVLAMVLAIGAVGILCLVLYLKNYARVPMSKGDTVLQRGEKGKTYILTVPMILAFILLLFETAQYVEF